LIRALVVLTALLASGCASPRAQREALLTPHGRELLDRYQQFMTQRQVEGFLAWDDDGARETYVKNLKVEDRLAAYPKPIQDAIWARDVVQGMDKPALFMTWGIPPERETSNAGGNEIETWLYVREQRKIAVVVTNGYVTDVIDQGFSR